jgi:hypothetical protein
MRVLLISILFIISLPVRAQIYEEGEDPGLHSDSGRPSILFSARGGLAVTPADPEVRENWKHDPFFSYSLGIGAYYAFPKSWKEFYFFTGADFFYLTSEEELRSNLSNSYVSTQIMQLLATVGITWEPSLLRGAWGFDGSVSYEVWGQKETKFETSNYNRNLGVEDTGSPVVWGLGTHFRLSGPWAGLVSFNHRINDGGDIIWLGGRYGF